MKQREIEIKYYLEINFLLQELDQNLEEESDNLADSVRDKKFEKRKGICVSGRLELRP